MDWNAGLDINLGGVFLCSQAAAKVPTGGRERVGREGERFAEGADQKMQRGG